MAFGSAKVHLIGNVGADPEMKFSQNGTAFTNFNVAVNRRQKQGEEQPPDWFRCTVFGKQGETAYEYIKKGTRIYVDGRLEIDKWTGQDGTPMTTCAVIVNDFVLLTAKDENNQSDPFAQQARKPIKEDLDSLPF